MRPANTVGGDYYDIIPLGEGRVAIVVGDVSGKGMPAALLMTMLQGSLRTLISAGFRGEDLVQKMNEYLVKNTPENKMVTLFFGELNTASGELTYTNAGHNPALLVKGTGGVRTLDSNSLVLGLLPSARFRTDHVTLEAGDRLIIYTDGIVEASNKRDEEFGEGRLRELAVATAGRPADSFREELYKKALAFCSPRAPVDDMTLMIVELSR
jgi:serine phosphatase RsbU (regulator of sigma subunit)